MVDVCLWLILVTMGLVPQASPTAPPRDATSRDEAEKPGTAIMRGRVTDRETGQPLGRVEVVLMSSVWGEQAWASSSMAAQTGIVDDSPARPNPPRYTATTVDGRFEFKHVPAGAYKVYFEPRSRGTHLNQSFGESAPGDPVKRGKRTATIELRDGETRENINVALWRAFAVDGRVVDDTGEPMANVAVTFAEWDGPSTMTWGMPRSTDDRGMFRLFGLEPGQYRVCAEGRGVLDPSEDGRDKLIRTCYPSAISDGDAQRVVVSSADVGPIEIRLQRNRTYKITGTVIDSSGVVVKNPNVSLISIPTGNSSSDSNIEVKPDGRFIATGATPGDYGVRASIGDSRFANPDDKRDREVGYVLLRVDGADIDDVIVTTSKAANVAGRVVFEGGAPDLETSKLSIVATPDELPGRGFLIGDSTGRGIVRNDLSFELDGLFGPQVLRVIGPPRGWIVKSVKYRGEDVTDTGVEFKSSNDPRLLEVTLTNRGAIVTGRVLDDDSTPAPNAFVVLLPADVEPSRPSPIIPASTDGTFTIGPVRTGEYIVAGAIGISVRKFENPATRAEVAEQIAKIGERIILVENDKRSIDVRIVKLQ
jgi:hypothetical protein